MKTNPQKHLLTALLLITATIAGCKTTVVTDYSRPLPPGKLALRKITDPTMIPNFTPACFPSNALATAIDNSLSYLSKPSSQQFFPYDTITHDHAVKSLKAFRNLWQQGLSPQQLNQAIRDNFDVYISIGCDDRGTVLFTGYYTPIFDGDTKPSQRFRYPLYQTPDDLVKDSQGQILGQKQPDGSTKPYPTRQQIELANLLAGKELIYLADPFETYVAHVQGSAKIRLPDGQLTTVGYAANNGREYQSVAQELVKDQIIPADQISLAAMIKYFKANPTKIDHYIQRNPRFVFFQSQSGPPRGSLNEPVTPMRSIATDKAIFPRASLVFIDTRLPRPSTTSQAPTVKPYRGFVCDQDTGGAIRAPGRCDVYMGQGPNAGQLAGNTYAEGKLYYLFLKPNSPLK